MAGKGGIENLVPNSMRSSEEVRRNSAKGGVNSGKTRRAKADLRKVAQALLDGTFKDKAGREITGADLIMQGLLANIADPKGKNWAKAMDTLISLTGANITPEQREKTQMEIKALKAKIELVEKMESSNGMLADLIDGLRCPDDIHTEATGADGAVADE